MQYEGAKVDLLHERPHESNPGGRSEDFPH